jgi:hypothetical protein
MDPYFVRLHACTGFSFGVAPSAKLRPAAAYRHHIDIRCVAELAQEF